MTQLFKTQLGKISFQTDATINLQPSISAQSLTHPCLACLYFTKQHFKTVIMLKTPTKASSSTSMRQLHIHYLSILPFLAISGQILTLFLPVQKMMHPYSGSRLCSPHMAPIFFHLSEDLVLSIIPPLP